MQVEASVQEVQPVPQLVQVMPSLNSSDAHATLEGVRNVLT